MSSWLFILELAARVDELRARSIAVTEKKFVRAHASATAHQVVVREKNPELIAAESNPERRRWRSNEIPTLFYDGLTHEIIDASKQTKHDRIYDRRYKIHKHSIDTYLLEVIKLKDFTVPSMQIEPENTMNTQMYLHLGWS